MSVKFFGKEGSYWKLFNLRHYKYELRSYEFRENSFQYIYYCIYYYMVRYTARIDQLMVETVVRLQFSYDEHNTKFQHHENLSLLSSHSHILLFSKY